MQAIRLATLIQILIEHESIVGKDALVGIACDSEGNSWSLIADEQFCSIETGVSDELGYNEFGKITGTKKALVLWPTN